LSSRLRARASSSADALGDRLAPPSGRTSGLRTSPLVTSPLVDGAVPGRTARVGHIPPARSHRGRTGTQRQPEPAGMSGWRRAGRGRTPLPLSAPPTRPRRRSHAVRRAVCRAGRAAGTLDFSPVPSTSRM